MIYLVLVAHALYQQEAVPPPVPHVARGRSAIGRRVALLISLFTVGLKIGGVGLFDACWLLPLRLASISMAITVGLIAAVGVCGLGLVRGRRRSCWAESLRRPTRRQRLVCKPKPSLTGPVALQSRR